MTATLVAGTISALITQRWSDRRETVAWARERQREHERWSREDQARTFEHRRESYVEFYEAVKALARTAYNHCYGITDEPELPEGWQSDAFAKLAQLEFYADRAVAAAASAAYSAAWSWGQFGEYDAPDDRSFHDRQQKYDQAELEMLLLMRQNLSIPEADLTLPPPGYAYMEDQDGDEGQAEEGSETSAAPRLKE
ncbi:hypothetical protein ACWC09_22920 [Streptomyces sp. NPDC001617]